MEETDNDILEPDQNVLPEQEKSTEPTSVEETRAESINPAVRPVGKVRSPVTIILLSIVTLGIYSIIYQYSIFDELKNWRGQGWSGGLYLVFTFLFPIPLIAIPWLVPAYVGRMYAEDNREKPITGNTGFWFLLPILGGIVWLFKVQNNMNSFWESKGVAV